MKRITFVLFFVVLMLGVKAQYNYSKFNYYAVGVKLGGDIYNYKMDPAKNGSFDRMFNYTVGVSGAYYYSWIFEFHGSVNYSDRRFAIDWEYPLNSVEPGDLRTLIRSEYRMKYINIPLEARVNALYLGWMKLNFGVGIMPDFRFKPNETQYYNDGDIIESEQYWRAKKFTRLLIAFPITGNIKFYLDRHFTIEFSAAYYIYANRMQKEFLSKPANAIIPRVAMYYEW